MYFSILLFFLPIFLSFSFLNSFIISVSSFFSSHVLSHSSIFPSYSSLLFFLKFLYHFCLQFSPSTFRFKSPGVTYVGKEINTERTRDTKKNREKQSTFPFQPTFCTSSNIHLFNDRVSNRNEAEPPPYTWLAISTNDQWDRGDRLNAHLYLRSDATQPGVCAIHFGSPLSCCQVNYKNRACYVIIRVTSLSNT